MALIPPPTLTKPFGEVLADLLGQGKDLQAFLASVEGVEGWSAESLGKMAAGELRVEPAVMEAVARKLHAPPQSFREYRAYQIGRAMEERPDLITDLWNTAIQRYPSLSMLEVPTPPGTA
jgi:hypothetical protein